LPNAFPQIGVVDADWNQLNNLYATRGEINIFDLLIDQEKIENFDVRPSLFLELENIPVWDRFDYLVLQLQAQIRNLLQFSEKEEVDPKRGFFDMGMDSLMALRLKAFLEKGFSIKLPPSIIFDYPKIELLAHHLLDIVFLDSQQELHSKQALEPTPTSLHSNSLQIIHESEQLSESEISKLIDNEWLELNSLKDSK
jgi:acyl carrier protein